MSTVNKVWQWLSLTSLALGLALVIAACDDGPNFNNGLDKGKLPEGTCTEYPGEGTQSWSLNAVVPPSVFEGEPLDLDLDELWCQKNMVKSLFFILGYPS